ncbi:small integral membrane protein 4, partial [Nilaparvata lugens]|uniref:small integral membrane protein 4 n=1 Tax=Nilaparvata lugens TaxID=108931 RepID=UPI00193E719C
NLSGYSRAVNKVLGLWPGKKYFGLYRFLPIFFFVGAGLEFTMINWKAFGRTNFYEIYKKKQVSETAREELRKEGILVKS